MRCITKEYLAT